MKTNIEIIKEIGGLERLDDCKIYKEVSHKALKVIWARAALRTLEWVLGGRGDSPSKEIKEYGIRSSKKL